MSEPSIRRVAMAKRVALKWLEDRAHPEYRISVYAETCPLQNLSGYLKAFRDGKARIAGLAPIKDLGVDTDQDKINVWSSDREGLIKIDAWLTKMGCETTGIW